MSEYISKVIMAVIVGPIPQKCNVNNHEIAILSSAINFYSAELNTYKLCKLMTQSYSLASCPLHKQMHRKRPH